MKKASEIRKGFLDFFEKKQHKIVPSSPIVVKNDPTLMFTNAGMNQFKDYFLGHSIPKDKRIADTQKCLRVSGKHNDLEEVGVDTYHHTMFEMLGNWSFGDYFKEEAIAWAWELLTEVYKIPKDRLYVTIFEGDVNENLERDQEAYDYWAKWISKDRIINGNKKDNFWEMGDTGPCGPCSEIHVDIRDDEDRNTIDGLTLVNASHPQVIEIWNNVFIQYNRKADGSLESLPDKHVDTGMGFERLCMVLQGVKATYDIDLFSRIIKAIEAFTNSKYGVSETTDIAIRVVADHIRAIAFTILDGQLPSNNGAGYVIRRILRRAVRYIYTHLNTKEPVLYRLLPVVANEYIDIFPEFAENVPFLQKVVIEEENSFLRTLEAGLKRFEQYKSNEVLDGKICFELYDTYGFPFDLTMLMAKENNQIVDELGFKEEMAKQKERSRSATSLETGDWVELSQDSHTEFLGYDLLETTSKVLKYRLVKSKNKDFIQVILDKTPFYAESGGQVGDVGTLEFDNEVIQVLDTKKENNLILHFIDKLPKKIDGIVIAKVNKEKRLATSSNHTATHLLHAALKNLVGTHVNQKGSLVGPDYLRFDFSHFAKIEEQDLIAIEKLVQQKITSDIPLEENRNMPYKEAIEAGATALFGEKYGDKVRMITFDKDYSRELCGGTHVSNTGQIQLCKVISEGSVAAGVRRIEALTGAKAIEYLQSKAAELDKIHSLLNNPKNIEQSVQDLLLENNNLKKELEQVLWQKADAEKVSIQARLKDINGIKLYIGKSDIGHADAMKKIAFDLKREVANIVLGMATVIDGKPMISLMIDEELAKSRGWNAANIIRDAAKSINGGGGGQAFYATAGGKNLDGLQAALAHLEKQFS